jgi:uncharacterized membrane protein YfcA
MKYIYYTMDLLLIPFSLIIGIIASMIGIGGGVLLVPIMILMGIAPHNAIALSVGAVALTSLSAFAEYFKQKMVDLKLALFLAAFSVPGAFLGAYLNSLTSPELLIQLFSGLLFIVAVLLWKRKYLEGKIPMGSLEMERHLTTKEGKKYEYKVPVLLMAPVSVVAGLLAGFFGIGGGVLKVPAMILSGIPTHISVATSTSLVTMNSTTALISHGVLGNELIYLLFIGPALIVGAQIGARLSKRMEGKELQKFFSIILLIFSVALLLKT